jgi:hypothetical protein
MIFSVVTRVRRTVLETRNENARVAETAATFLTPEAGRKEREASGVRARNQTETKTR